MVSLLAAALRSIARSRWMPCRTTRATPLAIPDPGVLAVALELPALEAASSVSLRLAWTHSWTPDLSCSLQAPGRSQQLLWEAGLGVADGNLTLQDGFPPLTSAALAAFSRGPFSRSDGQPLLGSSASAYAAIGAGNWTIAFTDASAGDEGSLLTAALCWQASSFVSPSTPPLPTLPPPTPPTEPPPMPPATPPPPHPPVPPSPPLPPVSPSPLPSPPASPPNCLMRWQLWSEAANRCLSHSPSPLAPPPPSAPTTPPERPPPSVAHTSPLSAPTAPQGPVGPLPSPPPPPPPPHVLGLDTTNAVLISLGVVAMLLLALCGAYLLCCPARALPRCLRPRPPQPPRRPPTSEVEAAQMAQMLERSRVLHLPPALPSQLPRLEEGTLRWPGTRSYATAWRRDASATQHFQSAARVHPKSRTRAGSPAGSPWLVSAECVAPGRGRH